MINLFNKKFKVKIADTISPNKNGEVFSKEALESMYKSIENDKIIGQLGSIKQSGGVELSKATHLIKNPTMENDSLMAEIEFLETPWSEQLKEILLTFDDELDSITFKPEGDGDVDPSTNKIYNYSLNSVNIFIEQND